MLELHQLRQAQAKIEIVIPEATEAISTNIRAFLSLTRYAERDDVSPETMTRLERRVVSETRAALEPLGYYEPQVSYEAKQDGRDWRVNFVSRYAFNEGTLRGSFVGAGYRFRSPQNLGYLATLVANEFPLTGAPAQVLVPARDAPIEGAVVSETELFLGYSRKLGKRVNWRVQLNIRNVFDDQDPMKQRANISAGFVTVYAVPEPRSFILTNTFTF